MSTATAEPDLAPGPDTPAPSLQAACDLMAAEWAPWHMVLYELTWADYDRLLAARAAAGRRRVRVNYDRGVAEIYTPGVGFGGRDGTGTGTGSETAMTVGNRHERWKKMIARLFEAAAEGFGVEIAPSGNVTLSRPDLDRGFEPDECYYVRNAARVAAVRELDLRTDPPPDVAIEIEVSRSLIDRLDLYAALGVPEIWRYDGDRLGILARTPDGHYAETPAGLAFPPLTAAYLTDLMARSGAGHDMPLCQEVRDRARRQAPPAA